MAGKLPGFGPEVGPEFFHPGDFSRPFSPDALPEGVGHGGGNGSRPGHPCVTTRGGGQRQGSGKGSGPLQKLTA